MEPKKLAHLITNALEDIKGVDIKVIDVQHLSSIMDLIIIVTGTSNRHVKSLADNLIKKAKDAHITTMHVEGEEQGEWVLVDLGDAVVHIMLPQTRDFYNLESLWSEHPVIAESQ